MGEMKEGWMRIIVAIVSGIILHLWGALVGALAIVNFLIVIFSGKRNKGIAEFSEMWNTQNYMFWKYMIFLSNYRPFPFNSLEKSMSKFEK